MEGRDKEEVLFAIDPRIFYRHIYLDGAFASLFTWVRPAAGKTKAREVDIVTSLFLVFFDACTMI